MCMCSWVDILKGRYSILHCIHIWSECGNGSKQPFTGDFCTLWLQELDCKFFQPINLNFYSTSSRSLPRVAYRQGVAAHLFYRWTASFPICSFNFIAEQFQQFRRSLRTTMFSEIVFSRIWIDRQVIPTWQAQTGKWMRLRCRWTPKSRTTSRASTSGSTDARKTGFFAKFCCSMETSSKSTFRYVKSR